MPEGTFFAKGEKWFIDGFCVKGETYFDNSEPIDFKYLNLVDFDYKDCKERADFYEVILETGQSKEINKHYMRDGCFCDEDVFLVFEKEDLDYIKSLMP